MAKWRQLLQPPSVALPGNLVTKAGIGVIAAVLVGLVLSQSGGDPETGDEASAEPQVTGRGVVRQLRSRLTQLVEQQLTEEESRGRTAGDGVGSSAPAPPMLPPAGDVGGADEPAPLPTAGEVELHERLRLEAIERRARSLRARSVVQTFRGEPRHVDTERPDPNRRDGGRPPLAVPAGASANGNGAPGVPPPPDPAALAGRMEDATAGLLSGLAGGPVAGPAPPARTVPGVNGPPVEAAAEPAVVTAPFRPGRLGAGLRGVVAERGSGDGARRRLRRPGARAGRDLLLLGRRQRILVPRGARLLGTAEAVRHQDQSRLAVGFHRSCGLMAAGWASRSTGSTRSARARWSTRATGTTRRCSRRPPPWASWPG